MALSNAAHWNQTEQDWRTMLALGRGWGLREVGGPMGMMGTAGECRLVASALVLPYDGQFAWISMVLVLPDARGRGHAGRLLGVALQSLASEGLLPVLDATPAGRPVYLKRGFADDWGFVRWRRAGGPPLDAPTRVPKNAQVRRLRESDWPEVAALDAPAFGASRLPLLRSLWQRQPALGWVVEGDRGELRAFLLGREGRTAVQLGPLVAVEAGDARTLLEAALDAPRRADERSARLPPLIVDLRDGHPELQAWLERQGFVAERPFKRMVLGATRTSSASRATRAPGDPARIVLIAGPELG